MKHGTKEQKELGLISKKEVLIVPEAYKQRPEDLNKKIVEYVGTYMILRKKLKREIR